jgi:hypothetical protein
MKVANPFKTELILLEQVIYCFCLQLEQHYAGCESAHASGVNGIGTFTLEALVLYC